MELKVIRKLVGQVKYCCKEGVIEIGFEGKPTLGNIWCCAKCGHPVEPSAQHPVVVELCKDLVKNYQVTASSVKLAGIESISESLLRLTFSNGEFACVCPKTYQVKQDATLSTNQLSVGAARLNELLDFIPVPGLEAKLTALLIVYMLNTHLNNPAGI